METDDPSLPYTVFTKVEGKPQLLKKAPVHVPEPEPVRGEQYPLTGVATKYPL